MLAQYATPTVTGEGAVSWDKGAHCVIPGVEIMGKCVQDGTPTPDAPIEPVFSEGTEVIVRGRNLANAYANGGYNMTNEKIAENTFRMTCGSATGGYGAIKIDNLPVGVPLRMLVTFCPEYPRSKSTYAIAMPRGACGFPYIHISEAYEAGVPYTRLSSVSSLAFGNIEIGLYNYMDNPGESAIWTISIYLDEQAIEEHTPYFDGGTAVAPQLLAIPGTEYMDTWDPQTGKGIRRIHKIKLSADDDWSRYSGNNGDFYKYAIRPPESYPPLNPTTKRENTYMCTHLPSVNYEGINNFLKYGILIDDIKVVVKVDMSTLDEWLQFLQENDVYVWYVLLEPEEFQTDLVQLIQPHGTGSIIQTGGTVDSCPITVKCVTHS